MGEREGRTRKALWKRQHLKCALKPENSHRKRWDNFHEGVEVTGGEFEL